MTGWLTFDPVISMSVSLLLIVIAAGGIILKEYINRKIKILNVLAVLIATLGLAGIFLRPSSLTTRNTVSILLTKNFDRDVLDSLIGEYPHAKIYSAPQIESARLKDVVSMSSWHDLYGIEPIDVVVGEGLPPHAMDAIHDKKILFLPSPPARGLFKLTIPESIKPNRPHEIRGEYFATEPTLLRIDGIGGISDSLHVEVGLTPVSFTFIPKTSGPLTLTLTEKTKQSSVTHKLGLSVKDPSKLTMLFLQDYPTFENSYLKNFFAREHAVAVRYRLSKNIFRYEYVNMKRYSTQRITNDFLNRFDIVLTTPQVLQTLSRSERAAIETAVRNGAGILLTGAGGQSVAFGPELETEKSQRDTVHVSLSSGRKTVIRTSQYLLTRQPPLNPVLMLNEKTLAGYYNHGFGRIGHSVVTESYPLILRGDSLSYSAMWTPILESISRRKPPLTEIRALSRMPFHRDHPVHLEIFATDTPPVLYLDSVRIPVIENPRIADHWSATIWPGHEGWNEIKSEDDSTVFSIFVNAPDEWSGLQSSRNTEITKRYASSEIGERNKPEWRRVHPLIFFGMFLIGMSALWLLPKIK
jgi:hypothetical protein